MYCVKIRHSKPTMRQRRVIAFLFGLAVGTAVTSNLSLAVEKKDNKEKPDNMIDLDDYRKGRR